MKRATASGNLETIQAAQTISTPAGASFAPEVQSVKFSNDDIVGWLQMAPEVIFKPPKAEWVAPPPVPQTIADNARIALFADWGTGLYGDRPSPGRSKAWTAARWCCTWVIPTIPGKTTRSATA